MLKLQTYNGKLIEGSKLEDLRKRFAGEIILQEDAAYEEASALWNGMIDKKPAVIARCQGVADVIAAVNFARDDGLTIAVRGGGHNVAGLASVDEGIVIDLSSMRSVAVDPQRRIARAGGGATWGDVDRETQAFGLATPGGVVSATGIAGLTLGGGMGWLRRKYGLSCDNLIAAEVVTADGSLVRASERENPDLLWGLRGGGGNFGIVTSFEYALHPVGPEVFFTFVFYPIRQAKKVLRFHERFLGQEPGEVSTLAVLGRVPHLDAFPSEIHGQAFVGVLGMYAASPDEGARVMQPLRELGEPLVDLSARMPYLEAQQIYDADYPNGMRYYWKSTTLMSLSDAAIEVLLRHAALAPSDHATIDIWYHGGKIAERKEEDTAYGRRDVPYLIAPEGNWQHPEDDEANIAWVRSLLRDLERYSANGLYLNFPGFLEEGDKLVRAGFGKNYQRLIELKNKYDPKNLFRMNQNIRPTAEGS